jgi:hypothetical protein
VKELSAEALQILSTALGIHLGFWAWVASDGFWQNTHSECNSRLFFVDTDCTTKMMAKLFPSIFLALSFIQQ